MEPTITTTTKTSPPPQCMFGLDSVFDLVKFVRFGIFLFKLSGGSSCSKYLFFDQFIKQLGVSLENKVASDEDEEEGVVDMGVVREGGSEENRCELCLQESDEEDDVR